MQKFASLRGLPGVEEQPIRRGKEKALVFPIPLHIEEAVSQVMLCCLPFHSIIAQLALVGLLLIAVE